MRCPLTKEEHARLRELLAAGRPLSESPDDHRLKRLGLVRNFYNRPHLICAAHDRLGPDGDEPYFERSTGAVNPVSYPTIGEEDVLAPGFFFAMAPGGGVTVVSVPED